MQLGASADGHGAPFSTEGGQQQRLKAGRVNRAHWRHLLPGPHDVTFAITLAKLAPW